MDGDFVLKNIELSQKLKYSSFFVSKEMFLQYLMTCKQADGAGVFVLCRWARSHDIWSEQIGDALPPLFSEKFVGSEAALTCFMWSEHCAGLYLRKKNPLKFAI